MLSYEGRDRRTENMLRTIQFDHPDWTPCNVGIMPATWIKYRENLEDVLLDHPRIFPGFRKGQVQFDAIGFPLYELGLHTDNWGTVWSNIERGLDSMTVGYPLEDWNAFETYQPPDPLKHDLFGERDWDAIREGMQKAKENGGIAGGGLYHGFMYMRLFYLRGFENLMLDIAVEDPRLDQLIEMIEANNTAAIRKFLEVGAEYMSFGDDLGLQHSLPMSPETWRKYIKPSYVRMLAPCVEANATVYLHTDGHILEIIPDLVEAGVNVLNPQFRANGLDGIVNVAKGRVALNQDLDRQLFPIASAAEIEDHIAEVHEALDSPEGGLMLYAECEPDVSLDRIDVICSALEKACNPPEE